jgi:Cu/Ag efflux protein CusF
MKSIKAVVVVLVLLGPSLAEGNHHMGIMDHVSMAVAAAKCSGVTRALDKATGTILIDHGSTTDIGWLAITMPFRAAPALLEGLKVGPSDTFEVKAKGAPKIVAFRRAARDAGQLRAPDSRQIAGRGPGAPC